uniref:Putative mitochondrial protein n=1 Tax=Tanacetum cinerariifolium TaxID=118510 RepID=A0A6L2JSJ5_TANCI|nr:putative mitochondrial protein [Tanacetum cinerariifolium]
MSICLDQECWTLLQHKAMALLLSQYNVIALKPAVSTGTPSSTTIDQDAPSTSTPQTTQETPSPIIPLGVEEADHDIEFHTWILIPLLIFQFQNQVSLSEPVDTPMVEKSKLDEDPQRKAIDPTCYHGMIGTLMYLTTNRPDLVFSMCMRARYQEKPTEKHLHEQFSYIIKKVKDSESYEFFLANKKCIVDAEVFRKILDICPRVEGEEFTTVQYDDATLTFLIELGYKGPLHKYTNIENVDYFELIWEDIAFQIDHMKEMRSRRETMPFLRFTRVIINHFLSEHKYIPLVKFLPRKAKGVKERRQHIHVNVSDSEPPGMKTASRRVIKKKVTIFAAENIVPDLDVTLELSKSIRLTKAAEKEAARQVHATHARIVTKSVPEPARRRPSGIAIRDTPQVSKKVFSNPSQKLKGVQSLTPEEQEATNTMKTLKESKKTSKRQPDTIGSSEGTGRIPGVPDESIVIYGTSSERTSTKLGIPDEEKITSKEKEYDEKKDDDDDDDKCIDLEMTNDEETEDEFVQVQETPLVAHVTTLPPLSVSTIPHVPHQTTASIPTPPITNDASTITTTIPEFDALYAIQLRVAKLEKDVSELKKIDHSAEALATLKLQVPTVVDNILDPNLEPVEEPIVEVVMDDVINTTGEDVVCDDDQPQETSEPKTYKTLNQDWFKQPPRPPTPDLE